MKVLFVAIKHTENNSGGKVISERNREFLEYYFGEKNVIYEIAAPSLKIKQSNVEAIAKKNKVDTVFIDASFIGFFSKRFYKKYHVITFFHNVEANYCDGEKNKSWIQKFRSILIKKSEKRNFFHSFKTIAINERDSFELKRIYGRCADCVIPSSMRDEFRDEINVDGEYLLFVGTDFYGNTDGLFQFVEKCMKEIDCNLLVVGDGMDRYKGKYASEYKTDFIGYVEDIASAYKKAKAVVLPIISGSGMKTKTCEALMYGKYIFGTKEAFEGYDIIDSDCITCITMEEFIEKINNFLKTNKSNYSEINRKLFLKKHENNVVYEKFKNFLDESVRH